ncbi:MAG TPA: toluene-4-monooxygenase system B family protein [Polyangiales bacterium]|jgi:toluene monooxygenase system protein A|nr:toluene-4-monooxygenase system B family protein [Polyangiales bacterium]
MRKQEAWLDLARKLDWTFSYVEESAVYPEAVSGTPWLEHEHWQGWDEPYRTTYAEYVTLQHKKDVAFFAVRDAVGRPEDLARLDPSWRSALKLHAATLPLAEFAAVIGNLRATRFGRDSAWRQTSLLGALDELRHTQIPLAAMHELLPWDADFDWTHKFFHTNNWVAIAGRHLIDELLVGTDAVEFAIATHFVFETGFTNLQFVGLSALARASGDRMFETMLQSIQTDEARHAQIGTSVVEILMRHDPERVQQLVDKWFWRSWLFFAVVTGFSMDYLTPLAQRTASFKEFVEEWVLDQFERMRAHFGLKRPWYWDQFVDALDHYHHMVYAAAYTHRATVWFDLALPSPDERAWLRKKYPKSWDRYDALWENVTERWRKGGQGLEWYTHGATPVGFCDLCQIVLCGGTPDRNTARVVTRGDRKYVFCSEPCAAIFDREPDRYAAHKNVVARILTGEAPANLLELLRYFGLSEQTWGRDVYGGAYPWLEQPAPRPSQLPRKPEPHDVWKGVSSDNDSPVTGGNLVPLYGFLYGDVMGLVVLAYDTDTLDEVAAKLQRAAAVRIAPQSEVDVLVRGRRIPGSTTVLRAGLAPLDRIDVVPRAQGVRFGHDAER